MPEPRGAPKPARWKKVMVFGVFDLLHPGHSHFLRAARKHAGSGGRLIAVVARDSVVKRLKGRQPDWSERKRMQAVRKTGLVDRAVLGDARQGSYKVIQKHKPDLVCLGYDQEALKKDLHRHLRAGELPPLKLCNIGSYKPVIYHTSLRRKKK